LRPLLGLNFENWLITRDQRRVHGCTASKQPLDIVAAPTFTCASPNPRKAAFSSFCYLMSGETPIFSMHWTLRGISKYRFLGCTAKEAQFCELAVPAIAQSSTFVTRDQDVQSQCPRGPAEVTSQCSALILTSNAYQLHGLPLLYV
jgi:hypothetical protein